MRSSQSSSNRGDHSPEGSCCPPPGRPARAPKDSSAINPPAILIRWNWPIAALPPKNGQRNVHISVSSFYHKRPPAHQQIRGPLLIAHTSRNLSPPRGQSRCPSLPNLAVIG